MSKNVIKVSVNSEYEIPIEPHSDISEVTIERIKQKLDTAKSIHEVVSILDNLPIDREHEFSMENPKIISGSSKSEFIGGFKAKSIEDIA